MMPGALLDATRAADAANKGRGNEIVPSMRGGERVLVFQPDPFTTLSIGQRPGHSSVTITTPQGRAELPGYLAHPIAEKLAACRALAIDDARKNFLEVVAGISGHIEEVFRDPKKLNRYGITRDGNNQGFAEVPGRVHPGATEYIHASKNTNGSGSIIEGRVAGVSFSIRPGWNPETKSMGLVVKAERYVAVDASFATELYGAAAEAVFKVIVDKFKSHPEIKTTLETPKPS